MSQTKIASFDDLRTRVHARVKSEQEKQASAADQGLAVPSEKDLNDKGNVSAPSGSSLEGNNTKKQTIPANDKANKDGGEAGKTLENSEAETHGSGEGKTVKSQDPKDEPTGDDLFRKQAKDIVVDLRERLNFGKQASSEESSEKKEEAEKKARKNEAEDVAAEMDGFTHDFHVKLASHLLSSEAGRDTVRQILSDAMSADAVDSLIKNASNMEKQAAEVAKVENFVKEAMSKMDEGEREAFIKSAQFHQEEVAKLPSEMEKTAYQQGAMDAAAMEAAGGALPPIPAEGDAPSLEEVVMILEQLVASGQIDPQMAEAILQELLASDPAAAEAAMAAGGGAGAMPKAASEKTDVDSLIDQVIEGDK